MTTHPEKVEVYQTSDGQLFSAREDAAVHESRLFFFAWCRANICRGGEWDAVMVADEILAHFDVKPKPGTSVGGKR